MESPSRRRPPGVDLAPVVAMLADVWRPLARFALLGLCLFAADRVWNREPPAPIVIPASRVEAVRSELAAWRGRPPSETELARALEPEIEEELLYREALRRGYDRGDPVVFRRLAQNLRFAGADPGRDDVSLVREARELGLHESDVVVRRRLVQVMRLELEAQAPSEPDDAELRAHFEAERERYRAPARMAFRQLYFRPEREAAAQQALADLRARDAPPEADPAGVDAFLHPAEQPPQSQREVANRFGAEFAQALFAVAAGSWSGPLRSAYGHHLVYVRAHEPARDQAFERVRDQVRLEWQAQVRRRALEKGLAALRWDARVHIEGLPDAPPG